MAASTTYSHWQYAWWVWNVGRNMRITNPTGTELAAVRTFLKAIWNPVARTGTRSWLDDDFKKKAVAGSSANTHYRCNIDTDPVWVLVELLGVVGNDMRANVPITTAEGVLINTLIAATGNRRYGQTPYFGGVGGSLVTLP